MSDLGIQAKVEMSTEGAEQALDRVADKAGQMARRMQTEGDKAGKAVDGIGDGATQAAEKFTRADGRMTEVIKRATKGLQELGKTASQKIELRIAERGLDPAKFEPMLSKLRELEAAQVRVGAASPKMGAGLQNVGYQLQDVIVQVNGGTDAMRALSMQLPQMLIGFGALGAGIGVAAALLPNLVNAFGGGESAAKTFAKSNELAAESFDGLTATVKQIDFTPLFEQYNEADEVTRALMRSQVDLRLEILKTAAEAARVNLASALTESGSEFNLLPGFDTLGNRGLKMAEQMSLIGQERVLLINTLRDLDARTLSAGDAFQRLNSVIPVTSKVGRELMVALSKAADEELRLKDATNKAADAQAKMAKGHITLKEETKASTKAAKAEAEELAKLMAKLNATDVGVEADYVKNVELLIGAWGKGKLTLDELHASLAQYAGQQKFMVAAERDAAKAQDEFNKHLEKERELRARAGQGVQDKAAAMERELANYGLLESAIYDKTVADLEEARILAMKEGDAPSVIASLEAQIDGYKRLAAAKRGIEAADTAKKAAEESAKAWENFARDIEQSLTDALMRSFESGASFGETFAKTLQNTFKSMVLKVAVQAVVNPVTGALQSAMTGKDPTMGMFGPNTLSTGSSLYNLATGNVGGGMYGAFATSSLGQSLGLSYMSHVGAAGPLATAAPALSGLGTALPYIGAALAAFSLLSKESTPHKGATAFSDGFNSLSPRTNSDILDQFANRVQPGQFVGDRYTSRYQQGIGDSLQVLTSGLAGSFNQILGAYGLDRDNRVGASFASDNDDDSRGRIVFQDADKNTLYTQYRKYDEDPQKGYEQFAQEAVNQLLLAVRGIDLNPVIDSWLDSSVVGATDKLDKLTQAQSEAILGVLQSGWLDEFLDQFGVAEKSFDDITAAVLQFAQVANLKPIFDALGVDIYKFGNVIADAFGGVDAAGAALSSYYDTYYSAGEKTARLTEMLGKEFDRLGVKMPETKEDLRRLIEQYANQGDAGIALAAQIVNLSGAFAQVADAADAAAKASAAAAEAMRQQIVKQTQTGFDNIAKYTPTDAVVAAIAKLSGDSAFGGLDFGGMGSAQLQEIGRAIAAPTVPTLLPDMIPGASAINASLLKATEAAQARFGDLTGALDTLIAAAVAREEEALRPVETDQAHIADTGIADQAARLAQQWQDRLDVLNGITTDRELALRNDLAAATDAATQAIIRQVYALEDQQSAADAAAKANKEAAEQIKADADKAIDAAMSSLERAIDAERKRLSLTRDDAQKSLSAVTAIFDAVNDGARTLRGQSAGLSGWNQQQARAYIDMAAMLASAGQAPDADKLADAIRTITSDNADNYATLADFDYAQRVQAGKLDIIGKVMGSQKSIAEQQLEAAENSLTALDDQLAAARLQLDALHGIDISVLSVVAAVGKLEAAMAGWSTAQRQSQTVSATVYLQTEAGLSKYTPDIGLIKPAPAGSSFTLPGFDVGTNRVPYDMVARIHKDEAIIPAPFNPWAGGAMPQGDNRSSAELLLAVRSLEARLARIEQNTTPRMVDEERPVRVQVM